VSGFIAESGRMSIVNASGETVFDTDEGIFVVTNRVSGSVEMPARSGSQNGFDGWNSPNNTEKNTLLASVNASADTVRGTISVSTVGNEGNISGLGRFNAGGSYMHYQGGITSTGGRVNHVVGSMAVYTFYASSGGLYINERVIIQADFSFADVVTTTTILKSTYNYDLFVGTFV